MKPDGAAAVRFEAAVPQITVADVVQTAEYYRDVLGFQIAGYWNGELAGFDTDPPPLFGIVQRDGVQVFFNRADAPAARRARASGGYDASVLVTGLEVLAAELRARGADIVDGPGDRIYGQRELVVRDCDGLVVAFGEASGS